ncbi:hypothetical protein L345_09511, partial [Ophiophagus hannah]
MTGKGGLYACEDPSSWEAVLNIYQDVIEAMGSKKKKLITLDQWYQEELPKLLAGREEKYLTKEELVKLMEWKLTVAILAAGAPAIAAFMADEVMEILPGLAPLQYTLKHYLLYMDKIQSCVKKLNKGNTTETWTAHLVEKCLWTWALAQKLRLSSLPIVNREEDEGDVVEQRDRARKKQRTK